VLTHLGSLLQKSCSFFQEASFGTPKTPECILQDYEILSIPSKISTGALVVQWLLLFAAPAPALPVPHSCLLA
jgi:hypothetical protein